MIRWISGSGSPAARIALRKPCLRDAVEGPAPRPGLDSGKEDLRVSPAVGRESLHRPQQPIRRDEPTGEGLVDGTPERRLVHRRGQVDERAGGRGHRETTDTCPVEGTEGPRAVHDDVGPPDPTRRANGTVTWIWHCGDMECPTPAPPCDATARPSGHGRGRLPSWPAPRSTASRRRYRRSPPPAPVHRRRPAGEARHGRSRAPRTAPTSRARAAGADRGDLSCLQDPFLRHAGIMTGRCDAPAIAN